MTKRAPKKPVKAEPMQLAAAPRAPSSAPTVDRDRMDALTAWLVEQTQGSEDTHCELNHHVEGAGRSRCARYAIAPPLSELDAGELAVKLVMTAVQQADAYTTMQLFAVVLMPSKLRFPLRLAPTADVDAFGSTEPANAIGGMRQAQRHVEVIQRQSLQFQERVLGTLAKRLEKSEQRVDELQDRRAAMLAELEELELKKHGRELEIRREDRKTKLLLEVLNTGKTLAPIVAGAVAKRLGAGEVVQPLVNDALIRELVSGLGSEQLAAVLRQLNPEQQAALYKIWEAVQAAEDKQAEAQTGEAN